MNQMEQEVLTEAARGLIVPTKDRSAAFRSLVRQKLIECKGDNKYKATASGLKAVMEGVTVAQPTAEVKETPKEIVSAPKKKDKDIVLQTLDAHYTKKYSHYVRGSVRPDDVAHSNKLRAKIECTARGCRETRDVYTSDIFQVKLCLKHKAEKTSKVKVA
jgi:hypothetical protein